MGLFERLKSYINKNDDKEMSSHEKKEQMLMVFDHIVNELSQYEGELPLLIKIKDRKDVRSKEVEEKVLSLIEENAKVLNYKMDNGENIGMYAARLGLEEIVLRSLDDNIASSQRDKINKRTIGMYAAMYKLERAAIKALDNNEASLKQDRSGLNIGMHCAIYKLKDATLKALDNTQA